MVKDIVDRNPGLQSLNRWAIDVLSHYSLVHTESGETLPLHQALVRVFQLLASGLLLPGAAGLVDPCSSTAAPLHFFMTQKQQDRLCYSSQMIVRFVSTSTGFKKVLGLLPSDDRFLEQGSEEEGVVIRPHVTVIGGNVSHANDGADPLAIDSQVDRHGHESSLHAEDNTTSLTLFADE